MNMKAICIALFACLFLAGTAMAYQTVLQMTLSSATHATYTINGLGGSTVTTLVPCSGTTASWCINVYDSSGTAVTGALKSATTMWAVGGTQTTPPITLTSGNLYGIRIGYRYIVDSTGSARLSSATIPCASTCTSSDYLWFTA